MEPKLSIAAGEHFDFHFETSSLSVLSYKTLLCLFSDLEVAWCDKATSILLHFYPLKGWVHPICG